MPTNKGIYTFTILGLLLGLSWDLMIRYEFFNSFFYSLIGLWGLLFALAYNEKNPGRLIVTSFLASLFLSLPLVHTKFVTSTFNFPADFVLHLITFWFAFPLFTYVGHSFHYAYHHDNTYKVRYKSLFAAVWNTFPLLLIALIFSLLGNLLILITATVFKTVGNMYLWNLYFSNMHFSLICNTTLYFIGLGIGQQNIKIIYSLRFLMLRMMYYLLPFLAAISVLYFVLYIIHSISGTAEYVEPLAVLIPLVTMGIIFFNGFFQDGTSETGEASWILGGLKIYRVVLFFLALMMAYYLYQNFSLDVNVLVYILVPVLHSLVYAISIRLPELTERRWICMGNIYIALFFIVAIFILNNPIKPIYFTVKSATAAQKHAPAAKIENVTHFVSRDTKARDQLNTIDNLLNSKGFYWEKVVSGNSFVAGIKGNANLYICRTLTNEGYQIGELRDNQCWISSAGKGFTVSAYQVLAHEMTSKEVKWVALNYGYGPFLNLGFEYLNPQDPNNTELQTLAACRVIYNNVIFIGKAVASKCNITVGDKEVKINNGDVLAQ